MTLTPPEHAVEPRTSPEAVETFAPPSVPRTEHVGRLRADGEQRVLRCTDAADDALAAEEEAEVEPAALLRHVDEHVRTAVMLAQLDARFVDELL